jgi:hypothetical protein
VAVRMERLPRIAPVLSAKLRTFGVFCASFGDKTGDKTPFGPLPKMAEYLTYLDATREPKDGFEPSVPS